MSFLASTCISAASTDVISSVQGLERLAEYDYVAIFDADFKPDTDFLVSDMRLACTDKLLHMHEFEYLQMVLCLLALSVGLATLIKPFLLLQTLTVPYLIDNPEVGYVQTRWDFANPDESYLTKVHCLPCLSPLPSCMLVLTN